MVCKNKINRQQSAETKHKSKMNRRYAGIKRSSGNKLCKKSAIIG